MEQRCFYCGCLVGWNADFDAEDYGYDIEGIVGTYTCMNENCRAEYEIFVPLTPKKWSDNIDRERI